RREALPCLLWAQVVVEFGNDRHQPLVGVGPCGDLGIRGAVQGWGKQNRALYLVLKTVLERHLGAERPADQPRLRQLASFDEGHGCRKVVLLVDSLAKAALRGALRRLHTTKVEAQH